MKYGDEELHEMLLKENQMKRKICFMEYDNNAAAYVETHTTSVARHKGLAEIERTARRECGKLQHKNPRAKLAYIIFDGHGDAVVKKEYSDD